MTNKETKLLAELYSYLKGPKKKPVDWITIAEQCSELVSLSDNSVKIAASKLGVSYQLLRTIIGLLKLPPEIQVLVKKRLIGYDAASRLNTIKNTSKQVEVANIISGLPSHWQREIIQHSAMFPNADLSEFRERVKNSREPQPSTHILILPIPEEDYSFLEKLNSNKKSSVTDMVSHIIAEWVKIRKEGRS